MHGEHLKQIRDALMMRRQRIYGAAAANHVEQLDMAGAQAEIIDIAQTLEQLDRDSSLAEQERRELLAIEHALGKLALGNFGICEECDEEIPEKRMQVVPEARYCARCQTYQERIQSRTRGSGMPGAIAS